MEFLFGSRKTVKEQLRGSIRAVDRSVRQLDSEIRTLEANKQKTANEIKKLAKQNEMDAVRILAKGIVRDNFYIKHFRTTQANFKAMGLKLKTMECTNTMSQTLKNMTQTMKQMNRGMKLPEIRNIFMNFEKECGILEAKEEMMSDAIDDVFGEEDPEESESIVNAVLSELGIELKEEVDGLPNPSSVKGIGTTAHPGRTALPVGGPGGPSTGPNGGAPDGTIDDDDLEARLARLKRG